MALAPWIAPAVLATYIHNTGIRLRRAFRGHTRHPGDAGAIVRACIEACWNGRTFTASPGHFDMFWTRDLSFSVPSLVRLGHGPRVTRSLAYALDVWARRRSHITTTIHYFDRPGDVFEYGVDSLPLFLAALRAADATDLVERYRPWLESEIAHYYATVVDPTTGLVRSDRKFSAHRDTVINRSNAFGNTMVALLAKTIEETGWFASPFKRHFDGDYSRLLIDNFWVDDHFRDALGDETVSGEANVWPFYAGVIADPVRVAAAPLSRCQRLLRPVSAALRDDSATRARGLAHPPRAARLPGQHGLDQPRGDVSPGAANGRPTARGDRDGPLRGVDRA